MKIVTTCPSEYFGVSRVFEDGQSLGLWKHIPLENISLPLEADLVIMGGAHPTYHVLLDKIPQPKWIMWTSPLLQTELASVEMERLLYFAREPRIQRIWFGEKTASSLFKKAFYAPYPVAIDRVASSDMLVAESPFAAEVAKLDVVTPPEGIGFFVPFGNKQKNVFTQLAAMKLFQETHPDVLLKTGGLLPEQARFADQIGLNYKDLGWRTGRDYYDDISQCKMTIHVSISESFGYCLTSDAFVLTASGLKTYDELTLGETVYSLDTRTGLLAEDRVNQIFAYDYDGDICHFNGHNFQMRTTPNHRVLLWNGGNSHLKYHEAQDTPSAFFHIPSWSTGYGGKDVGLSNDEIRMLAWAITEGEIPNSGLPSWQDGGPNPKGGRRRTLRQSFIRITQSQRLRKLGGAVNPNLERIESLLERLELDYGKYLDNKPRGWSKYPSVAYRVSVKDSRPYIQLLGGKKNIPPRFLQAARSQLNVLIDEMILGDGHIPSPRPNRPEHSGRGLRNNIGTGEASVYFTADESLAKSFSTCAFLAGYSPSMQLNDAPHPSYEQKYGRRKTSMWRVSLCRRNFLTMYTKHRRREHYRGKTFCISTNRGNFVASQSGRFFVTGNSVMDSMLLGVPCLTSRAVSWVPLNLGLTCDPYDPTTIGTAISSLYSLEPVPPVRQIAKSVAMARNGQLESLMASWKDLLYNPEP